MTDPVVVATSPTYNGGNGTTVRIRNINPQGFEVRLHEWDCHDGPHTTETLGWIAVGTPLATFRWDANRS